ncbi:pilin [Haloechinothrix halophila]|uniref:pilin n=1 Tax=Haloechinothrix halophila TaxID=1069073 RepID=UPI000687DA42|nr:pilin [Haloechinothrix halophila]
MLVVAVVVVVTTPPVAWAQTGQQQLEQVIANLRNFLVGLLVGLSTLFLTLGGVRYLAADGDPGEVERAKKSLRNALLGYALAALAPVAVSILRSLVG